MRKLHMTIAQRLEKLSIPEPMSGCHLWISSINPDGYGSIQIGGRNGIRRSAHRVAWEVRHGEIPPGASVLHKCDVPSCINPDHLFLGTQRDNVADMVAKGRSGPSPGEANGNAILTDEKVRAIRADGRRHWHIAKTYGICRSLVSMIKTRQAWRHVT